MDSNLLQSRTPAPPLETNNEEEQPDVTQDQDKQFRDLAVEGPQPPVRMKLDPPVEYDGKKYAELVCDFDKMIGKDFQYCERTFQRL